MSNEKIKCARCGEELDKYFVTVEIKHTVVLENVKFPRNSEFIWFCLKCYFRFERIVNLIRDKT